MFFVQITFNDGISPTECFLVKKPAFTIGASRFSDVIVEGVEGATYQLQIARGFADTFLCEAIGAVLEVSDSFVDSHCKRHVVKYYAGVRIYICLVDLDLRLQSESERVAPTVIVKRALSVSTPQLPAISIIGEVPATVSIAEGDRVTLGRSPKSTIRLDSQDVSSLHCRLDVSDGALFAEDLSQGATLINGETLVVPVALKSGDTLEIGAKYQISPLYSEMRDAPKRRADVRRASTQIRLYPCLYTKSELVKPGRFVLLRSGIVTIGREPANDIWIGAAHISRNHCEIEKHEDGSLLIRDLSSNGTVLDGGQLPKEVWVELTPGLHEIDFGAGAILYLCHSQEDEGRAMSSFSTYSETSFLGDSAESASRGEFDAGAAGSDISLNQGDKFSSQIRTQLPISNDNGGENDFGRTKGLSFNWRSVPRKTLITGAITFCCFCILLWFVAYVLYGIAVNL